LSATRIEISKKALVENIESFKKIIGSSVLFAAVVKSNAYGHGILEISRIALESGANLLAVNSLEEAILLRKNFPKAIIMIMGEIANIETYSNELNDSNFWVVCSRFNEIQFLNRLSKNPKVHLKTDTGMSRLGYSGETLYKLLEDLSLSKLKLHGILTHFASTEDFTEHSYTKKQIKLFQEYIKKAEDLGFQNLIKHSSSSASTLLFKEAHFDMVRIGISLYGLWPSLQTRLSLSLNGSREFQLKPVLSWKTKIVHIQELEPNQFVGYGSTYKTTKHTKLGVIPVGYFEGYDRRLSNLSYVLVKGERAKLLGRVCMNMSMIDLTSIDSVEIGEDVILIGQSGAENLSADYLAELTNTINYQIVTNIHSSIEKVVIGE
jgi:alanine racemase